MKAERVQRKKINKSMPSHNIYIEPILDLSQQMFQLHLQRMACEEKRLSDSEKDAEKRQYMQQLTDFAKQALLELKQSEAFQRSANAEKNALHKHSEGTIDELLCLIHPTPGTWTPMLVYLTSSAWNLYGHLKGLDPDMKRVIISDDLSFHYGAIMAVFMVFLLEDTPFFKSKIPIESKADSAIKKSIIIRDGLLRDLKDHMHRQESSLPEADQAEYKLLRQAVERMDQMKNGLPTAPAQAATADSLAVASVRHAPQVEVGAAAASASDADIHPQPAAARVSPPLKASDNSTSDKKDAVSDDEEAEETLCHRLVQEDTEDSLYGTDHAQQGLPQNTVAHIHTAGTDEAPKAAPHHNQPTQELAPPTMTSRLAGAVAGVFTGAAAGFKVGFSKPGFYGLGIGNMVFGCLGAIYGIGRGLYLGFKHGLFGSHDASKEPEKKAPVALDSMVDILGRPTVEMSCIGQYPRQVQPERMALHRLYNLYRVEAHAYCQQHMSSEEDPRISSRYLAQSPRARR